LFSQTRLLGSRTEGLPLRLKNEFVQQKVKFGLVRAVGFGPGMALSGWSPDVTKQKNLGKKFNVACKW